MSELMIRQDRDFATTLYQRLSKQTGASSTAGASKIGSAQTARQTMVDTVSVTVQRMMNRLNPMETSNQQQLLRTGEGALAEARDTLSQMSALAKAALDSSADTAALQAELETLVSQLDRILQSAAYDGTALFQDGDGSDLSSELNTLSNAIAQLSTNETVTADGETTSSSGAVLPDWLTSGLTQSGTSTADLLAALGLDSSSSSAELLNALLQNPLGSNTASDYMATLYLGSVIAGGGTASGDTDLSAVMDGLNQLMDMVADGVPLDEALQTLTNGAFSSLSEFEAQFNNGTAPTLIDYLDTLLLTDNGASVLDDSIATLIGELFSDFAMDIEAELLGGLLDTLGLSSNEAAPESGTASDENMIQTQNPEPIQSPEQVQNQEPISAQTQSVDLGGVQVSGSDLSGVSFDSSTGVLTFSGTGNITISEINPSLDGTGANEQGAVILINGSGTVTLQEVNVETLTIAAPDAHILSEGETVLNTVELYTGVSVTLGGTGLLDIDRFQADQTNTIRLTGGAVIVDGGKGTISRTADSDDTAQTADNAAAILMDGAASLAARVHTVVHPNGNAEAPVDVLWKTMLPGWASLTSMTVDGKTAQLSLLHSDAVRLWLEKEVDPSHGYPVHTVTFTGKDEDGQVRTRYAYLRWDDRTGRFREITMYPNPFTVTGGEEGEDWEYDENSHALHILTARVDVIEGGTGLDAEEHPFSGKLALSDNIGELSLTLGGVDCQVTTGKAFDAGHENDLTLLLRRGTKNVFRSGFGCAGLSIGSGTSLCLDTEPANDTAEYEEPAGALKAVGGIGGAGIGRDKNSGWDRICCIRIQGGVINAVGRGAAAGIGAGLYGSMGDITITGGTITAVGGNGGGAGIGGALHGSIGTLTIRGGVISAESSYQAAAIGAGIHGECGDITVSGTARIVKALGGNLGEDIGACRFGSCGTVTVSDSADIGTAVIKQPKPEGITVQTADHTVTVPQFRLSSKALKLHDLSVTTRNAAEAAQTALRFADFRTARIQSAYNALYSRIDDSLLQLRDVFTANETLDDTAQTITEEKGLLPQTHNVHYTDSIFQFLQ